MSTDIERSLAQMQQLIEGGALESLDACQESLGTIGDALADLVTLMERQTKQPAGPTAEAIGAALAKAMATMKTAVNVPPPQIRVEVNPTPVQPSFTVPSAPEPVIHLIDRPAGRVVHQVAIEYSRGLPVRMTITRET